MAGDQIPSWPRLAACGSVDPNLFFDRSTETFEARTRREHNAKAICRSCRVRRECLRAALRANEPYGVWGGLNHDERRALDDAY